MGIRKLKMKKRNYILFLLFLLTGIGQSAWSQTLQKKDTSDARFLNSRKFFIYKVEKGETLFSISQKFKIPQEEILQFNPDIQSQGLKTKSKLWIPAWSWLNEDIGNAVLSEERDATRHNPNDLYQIAVITTLSLSKQYLEKKEIDSAYIDESLDKEITRNIDFIESVRYGLEKLSKSGVKIQLTVIDSESDTLKLIRLIKKDINYSAIITNENGPMLKIISTICQSRNIKLFATEINSSEIIRNNKNAVSLIPSALSQCESIGEFASKYFPGSNAIILKTNNTKENERSIAFKHGWAKKNNGIVFQSDYVKNGIQGLLDSLSKSKNTVIFISTSNEAMVTSILSALRDKKNDYRFHVIGLPTWQSFETVDPKLLEQTNVILFNSGQSNFNPIEVIAIRKYFREKFGSEPRETALQGYDAAQVLIKCILENGKSVFINTIPDVKGLFTNYHFTESNDGASLENKEIHVFKAGEDESEDLAKKIK